MWVHGGWRCSHTWAWTAESGEEELQEAASETQGHGLWLTTTGPEEGSAVGGRHLEDGRQKGQILKL